MTKTLMLMGAGPQSSKTAVGVALCRALSNAGVRVAPFKAISVVKERERSTDTRPLPGLGVIHQVLAARCPFEHAMNPVMVWQTGAISGDLYVNGKYLDPVKLANEDLVVPGSIQGAAKQRVRQAVGDAYRDLTARYDFVVIEGASCPADLPEEEDLPNVAVARMSRAPIVLSCQFSRGGGGAALIGTGLCLPPDVRSQLRGIVFSDVREEALAKYASGLVTSFLHVPLVGTIPRLSFCWSGLSESVANHQAYDLWAETVTRSLNMQVTGLDELLNGLRP